MMLFAHDVMLETHIYKRLKTKVKKLEKGLMKA